MIACGTTLGKTAFKAAAIVAIVLAAEGARAEPLRIRLRGSTHIEARTQRAAGRLVVRGNVLDDAGQPIAKERVSLVLLDAHAPGARVALGAAGVAFDGCDARAPERLEGDVLAMETDELGAFCARLALPVVEAREEATWIVRLTTRGSSLTDAVTSDLRVEASRRTLSLVFDPRPRIVSLDEPQATLEALARLEDEGAAAPAAGLALVLATEEGAPIARATTGASGRARWTVPTKALGAPGRGELRITFAGDVENAPATAAVEVERHAKVTLTLAGPAPGASVPEEGVALAVLATSVAGPAPGGTVEAYVGDALVGAAPVAAGRADLVVTFAHAPGEARLRLRYGWSAPWLESGPDLAVTVPVRPPSPWRSAPWALGVAAVVAFLAVGRARRARSARAAQRVAPAPRAPEAIVEVVREARERDAGWTGVVLDAHEGDPVAGARVAIERGGFQGVETVTSATTDAEGGFALAADGVREGDELAVEGHLHAALRQPVPSRGELRVALVLRRRALLDRLVAWARRRGKPYDTRAEPTPGHVRKVALEEAEGPGRTLSDDAVARGRDLVAWAEAVERAAFGGGEVDAQAEADVEALRPEARGASEKRR